jgi:hypothetical protein
VFLVNPKLRARFERLFRHSAAEIADRWAKVAGFLLRQAEAAQSLLRAV